MDPERDLVPVCPNCHAFAHLRTPPYTVDEVGDLLRDRSSARDAGQVE